MHLGFIHLPDTEEAAAPSTLYLALYDRCPYWSSNASSDSPLLQSSCPEDPNIYIYIYTFGRHVHVKRFEPTFKSFKLSSNQYFRDVL